MRYDRYGHSVVILSDRIYAIGGDRGGIILQAVERYDFAVDKWHAVADLPVPLYRCTAVAHNGHLYTFGGLSPDGRALSTTLRYDPQTDAWSELTGMPTARFWCSACGGPDGLIYVFGSFRGNVENRRRNQ
ncbi:kelch repeat and BTB domain-containing protein 12-like isoform X2 [Paramacrobiotus metropolitanus]|uniref:kelch repeat and BTB domain-containing protein 12-like isoform X2 n=1 Tax=Paramacrobiotus metropolitanus TaxID=2943436 RepID=UPI0024457A35|nr:kelch repeat and BTB domain-containing protein 12-like isoform X2 [Paramacrobiotus metropolitanus]